MLEESLIGSALNKSVKKVSGLNCPLCGGKARNSWKRLCFLNFVVFLIIAVLALIIFVISCFGVPRLGIIFLPFLLYFGIIIAALLFTLPITAAIAIASRSRCRVCKHRFWPESSAPKLPADVRSPWILTVIGIVILLAVFYSQVVYINSTPENDEMIEVTIEIPGWIFLTWLILGISMIGQALFWRNIIGEVHNGSRYSLAIFLPFLFLIAGLMTVPFYFRSVISTRYGPFNMAPIVLSNADLADLPVSARNIRTYTPHGIFSNLSDYLCFEAEPNDIELFLAKSPALEGITYETYSKDRMRIDSTWDLEINTTLFDQTGKTKNPSVYGHEYFQSRGGNPDWYKEEIRGKGRYYEFNGKENNWHGELIVDDEKHVVYIHRWN